MSEERGDTTAPLVEAIEPAVPFVRVDSYQALLKMVELTPFAALLIICEQSQLPAHHDLTPLMGKAPIYIALNVGVAEKLILHYLLFYLTSRALAEQHGDQPDVPAPIASNSKQGGIDWRKSLHYIHDNINRNDLTLEEVARQTYVCKWHYSKLFKQQFGVTFREYLITARIERAKQLLRANQSVTDVCYAVGYGDLAHFGRIFRKKVGMTPSDYRRQNQRVSPGG